MSALVGLFDSGLGGLTVLRRLQERYPHSSCLYLGDTARVPYGQRSVPDIRAIAAEVVAHSPTPSMVSTAASSYGDG